MNKKYEIHPDGSVTYKNISLSSSEARYLAEIFAKDQEHVPGTFRGEDIDTLYGEDTEYRIGCQRIPMELTYQFAEEYLAEKWKIKTYKTGQRFLFSGICSEEYILACVEEDRYALIGLATGNRWQKPCRVENKEAIKLEELVSLDKLSKFTPIED